MQPQHVRSPSSPVLNRTISFVIDNLANSSFCLGHHNEATWWGNSFMLAVIFPRWTAHLSYCLLKSKQSQATACLTKMHVWLPHVCVRVSVSSFVILYVSSVWEQRQCLCCCGWSGLSHYSIMWPCLIVSKQFFLYHSSRLNKSQWDGRRDEGTVDSTLYVREIQIQGGSGEQEQKPPQKTEVWMKLKGRERARRRERGFIKAHN